MKIYLVSFQFIIWTPIISIQNLSFFIPIPSPQVVIKIHLQNIKEKIENFKFQTKMKKTTANTSMHQNKRLPCFCFANLALFDSDIETQWEFSSSLFSNSPSVWSLTWCLLNVALSFSSPTLLRILLLFTFAAFTENEDVKTFRDAWALLRVTWCRDLKNEFNFVSVFPKVKKHSEVLQRIYTWY